MADESAHGGIYEDGPFKVDIVNIAGPQTSCGPRIKATNRPPKPLLVALPNQEGEYPIVQFQHGYTLQNMFYSQLMQHVASHGFLVVAPQMYTIAGPDATGEIAEAAAILDWLPTGLVGSLPARLAKVRPNFGKVAVVGHSRGAKVVFGLALGVSNSTLQYSAIAALDPVDGTASGSQTKPPILRFSKHSFNLGIPTLILGTGLGPIKRTFLFPPCAPEGVSHKAFYLDSSAPAYHFVATEYGHMDFLDDDTKGPQGKLTTCVCKNGPSRAPMRRFTGGILVAFFQATLLHNTSSFHDVLVHPDGAPVLLEPPESYVSEHYPNSTSDLDLRTPVFETP